MTTRFLYYLYFIVVVMVCIVAFPHGLNAAAFSALLAVIVIFLLKRTGEKADQLIKVFMVALILRTVVSTAIHSLELTQFFALDWMFYNNIGIDLADYWLRDGPFTENMYDANVFNFSGTSWGMGLFVGIIYSIAGSNMLSGQLVIVVIGAATAPIAYLCSYQIYNNKRTALLSGYIIAVFPSLVLWSSLLLKDGLIIFFLISAIYTALKLQDKLDSKGLLTLLACLAGLMAFRFYIFYIAVMAIACGFLIGQQNSVPATIRRVVVVVVVALGLIYGGVLHNAEKDVGDISSLQRIQDSRNDLANSAASGFGKDLDVSTPAGAIAAIPIGLLYLMLAPFPWQITSTLSAITMPEMILWWIAIPLIIYGIKYSIKYRLRQCLSMIIFTGMLMIGYSILQGNVGTAYRTRAQIQVFLFMFLAVGVSIILEKGENQKLLRQARKQQETRRKF